MIKVFHAPRTRSLRVLWMAEEMGLAYEVETVDFMGERSPAFLAANPSNTLPAMIDGAVTLTESVAILQYLADRHGPTDLAVKVDEPGYPDYLQFLILGEAGLGAPLNGVIATMFRAPDDQKQNWTVKAIIEGFLRRLKLVENRLKGREYLAADRFTAADISVTYVLGLGVTLLKLEDRMPPVVVDYYNRMVARPAFQRASAV
jgi:glutathione S-transferase